MRAISLRLGLAVQSGKSIIGKNIELKKAESVSKRRAMKPELLEVVSKPVAEFAKIQEPPVRAEFLRIRLQRNPLLKRPLDLLMALVVFGASAAPTTCWGAGEHPLILAQDGQTKYQIVIGEEAHYGEELAARELALFLNQMTGAEFPIRRDDQPTGKFEIVLGNTSRKSLADVPAGLKTDNWEGFAIIREGANIFIMGNIPRGTLYGVYDLLDVELGVRFLADEVNHVVKRSTLKLDLQSRTVAPPIERRTIWEPLGGDSMLRNRLNGAGFAVLDTRLGGVKVIGPSTHTFNALVPVEKYFDEHPEYFSEIDGKRRRQYDGIPTQLCCTNPDVAEIALETLRGWLGPEVNENPFNKYIVSVTVNDSPWFCKCAECRAVNQQEGVEEGATIMRFVNTIATQLAKDYPAVAVETMVYGTSIPQTKPVANVIMQMVKTPDMRYSLDDPTCADNREALAEFRRMKEQIGAGGIYNWLHLGTYSSTSYLDPRPNLKYLAHNIRRMNECGMIGFFAQTVQSRGTEMQALRSYLIARSLWRPELEGREIIEEFCRLYYQDAARDVLRYIDLVNNEYAKKDRLLNTPTNTTAIYDDSFLARGDAMLAAAEAKARTPEIKQRVATCRLPIWKIKLDRAFGDTGRLFSFPVEWAFKIDPQDEGLAAQWQKTTSFADWRAMRIDEHWTSQGEQRRGAGWYGIEFEMPQWKDADNKGGPLALWIGAVDGTADIFLDGEKIGEQKLPPTSMWQHGFYIPLRNDLAPGKHTLVIRVFKSNYKAGIWKKIAIVDMSAPISEDLRVAGERFVDVARAAELTILSESYGGHNVQTEKMYYPKVEFFLKYR